MNINNEVHPDDLVIEDLPITLELQVPEGASDKVNIVKAGTKVIEAIIANSAPGSLYSRIYIGMDILSRTETTAVVRFEIENSVLNQRK